MSGEKQETFEDHLDRFVPDGRTEDLVEAQDLAKIVEGERKRIVKDGPIEENFFGDDRNIIEDVLPKEVLSRETNYRLLDNQISDKENQIKELERKIAELKAVKAGKADMDSAMNDSLRSAGVNSLSTEEAWKARDEILNKESLEKKRMKNARKGLGREA